MAFPSTDDLVDYWSGNNASGDETGLHNGHVLTASGSPGSTTGLVYALTRDLESGSNQYFRLADATALGIGGDVDFTLMWVGTIESKGANRALVCEWDFGSNARKFLLQFNDSIDRFQFFVSYDGSNTGNVIADNFGSPSVDTVYFIICQVDKTGNLISISVNNGTPDTESYSNGLYTGYSDFRVGEMVTSSGSVHDGRAFPVALWLRLLSSGEITDLWNGGSIEPYADNPSELTMPTPEWESADDAEVTVSRVAAVGGTPAYSYQWQLLELDDTYYDTVTPMDWQDVTGETGTTLVLDSLTPGTAYMVRVKVTDSIPDVAYSRAIFVKLWAEPITLAFLGDSINVADVISACMTELGILAPTRTYNHAAAASVTAGGATAASWLPGNSLYDDALVDLLAEGVTHVHLMLGTNDAYGSPVPFDDYHDDIETIANDLVSEGFIVILSAPPYTEANITDARVNALYNYAAQLDAICNGTTILRGDRRALEVFSNDRTLLEDGTHPSATGETALGRLWANAIYTAIEAPTPAQIAAAVWTYGDRTLTA